MKSAKVTKRFYADDPPFGCLRHFLKSSSTGSHRTHIHVLAVLTRHPWRFDPAPQDFKKLIRR